MNRKTLLAWLRGELEGDERTQVTVWLIECTDPELPSLLFGLEQKIVIERQLGALAASTRAALSASYRALLRAFKSWEALVQQLNPGAALHLQEMGPRTDDVASVMVDADVADLVPGTIVEVGFRMGSAADIALWVVPTGSEPQLLDERHGEPAGTYTDVASWQIDVADGDVTVWLFHGPPGSIPSGASLGQLGPLLESGVLQLVVGAWEFDPDG